MPQLQERILKCCFLQAYFISLDTVFMVVWVSGISLKYVGCSLGLLAALGPFRRKSNLQKRSKKEAKTEVANLFSQKDWYNGKWQLCPTLKTNGEILVIGTQQAKLYLMTSMIVFLKWALLLYRTMELHLENWKLLLKMFWAKIV